MAAVEIIDATDQSRPVLIGIAGAFDLNLIIGLHLFIARRHFEAAEPVVRQSGDRLRIAQADGPKQ